jgi:hypothetical protein
LGIFKGRLSKADLVKLFLTVSFPIQAWSIFLVIRDADWVIERTNISDWIGYASYSLVYALGESIIVFIIFLLFSFLTFKDWKGDRLVSQLGTLAFVVSTWTILNQVFFLINPPPREWLVLFIYYRIGFKIAPYVFAALVTISVVVPMFLIHRYDKVDRAISNIFERLTLLTILYLVLDAAGLIVVLVRNLT